MQNHLPFGLSDVPTSDRHETLDILLRGFAFLALTVVIIWGLIAAKAFLMPLTIAALLAMLMTPFVHFLKRWKFPEWLAVACASLGLFVPLMALAYLALLEVESFIRNWPQIEAAARASLESILRSPLMERLGLAHRFSLATLQESASGKAGEGAVIFLNGLRAVLASASHLALILVLAVVMLASRVHLRRSFESILVIETSPERAVALDASLDVLQKFLLARSLIVVFVAIADFIVLKLFGLPYAVILAVILGLSTLLPVIGFFLGIIPALLVAGAQGHSLLSIAGIFASVGAISSLQDHALIPKLIGEQLNLNFLATYVALFAGERIWGLSGMFLSIPALGLLRVALSASNDLKPWARLLEGRPERHKQKCEQRPNSVDQKTNVFASP